MPSGKRQATSDKRLHPVRRILRKRTDSSDDEKMLLHVLIALSSQVCATSSSNIRTSNSNQQPATSTDPQTEATAQRPPTNRYIHSYIYNIYSYHPNEQAIRRCLRAGLREKLLHTLRGRKKSVWENTVLRALHKLSGIFSLSAGNTTRIFQPAQKRPPKLSNIVRYAKDCQHPALSNQ